MKKTTSGFTLVELLIVIVIIGILAAITAVAYGNLTRRAQNAKIASDIAQIQKAIVAARNTTGKDTNGVTGLRAYGSGGSSSACLNSGYTDLTSATTAPACWDAWKTMSTNLSTITGANLANLKDPWGQPYVIATSDTCGTESIFAIKPPVNGWNSTRIGSVNLPSVC